MMKNDALINKKGMALLTVILFFMVLIILMGGTLAMTNTNLKNSILTKNHTAAFYTSEAGLTMATQKFEKELNNLTNTNPGLTNAQFISAIDAYIVANGSDTELLSDNNGSTSYVETLISSLGIDAQGFSNYQFTSEGFVGDISRTLIVNYRFKYTEGSNGNGFIISNSILAKDSITLDGGTIHGAPIASYSSSPGAVSFDWGASAPAVEIPDNTVKTTIVDIPDWSSYNDFITEGGIDAVTYLEEIHEFPTIVMPSYPNKNTLQKLPNFTSGGFRVNSDGISFTKWVSNLTYNLPTTYSAYYVPNIIITDNEKFTINVQQDTLLVVDKLQITKPMQVTGPGTLTIYVTTNEFDTLPTFNDKIIFNYSGGNGYVGNISNPERVKIFVDPVFYSKCVKKVCTKTPIKLEVSGDATFYISLMAANLDLLLSGSGKIDGYVVTGGTSVVVSGGSSSAVALYYAPLAKFELIQGGSINGAVIANQFYSEGGVNLYYYDVAFDNFPFEVLDPISGGIGGGMPTLELIKGNTIEQ